MKNTEIQGPAKAAWWVSDVGYRVSRLPLRPQNFGLEIHARLDGEGRSQAVELDSRYVDVPIWITINAELDTNDAEHLTLTYNPLEVPNLHRLFAKLSASSVSIVEFANEYGFLGRRTERMVSYEGKEGDWENEFDEDEPMVWGELIEDWTLHVGKMRALIELWDLYRDPSPEAFERLQFMLYLHKSSVYLNEEWQRELTKEANELRDHWREDKPGRNQDHWSVPFYFMEESIDIDEADISEINPLVDEKTRLRLAARILLRERVNEELRYGTHAAIDVKDGSQIYLVPADLLGAMYIMFAQELVGKSVPAIQCAGCGAYFIPVHGRQRYCEERCKAKGYRQRKKEKANG